MLRVDSNAALPVYEQIREQVVRMVVAGTLLPGTRMPTIRQLASDLHLAKGTVAKAYALLESHGVVESRGHKGTFILEPTAALGSDAVVIGDGLSRAAEEFVIAARQMGVDQERAVAEVQARWQQLS